MYTNEDITKVLKNYVDAIEAQGHKVYAIMLKGSQNYNLSDSESDIDANAILIPKLSEIRNPKSEKFIFTEGEVTCHNIYSFAEIVAKGNPQWVEVCNTTYKLGHSLEMFKHFNINPSALKGMVMEKVNAFDKLYPSRAAIVKRFGYDPKQLHHIIRLYHLLEKDTNMYSYTGKQQEWMMKIKRGTLLTKEQAFTLRDEYIDRLDHIYPKHKAAYKPQQVDFHAIDDIVLDYLINPQRSITNKEK